MSLSNLGKKIENIVARFGTLLLRRSDSFSFVNSVALNDTITVSGTAVQRFVKVGDKVELTGNASAGTCAITAIATSGSNTTVTVNRDITADGESGQMHVVTLRNVGRIAAPACDWSVVTSDPDTTGRVAELALDFSITTTLQQTSDTEISALEDLTGYEYDVLLAPALQAGDVDDLAAARVDGFYVENVSLTAGGRFPFDASNGSITLTIPFRVLPNEVANL